MATSKKKDKKVGSSSKSPKPKELRTIFKNFEELRLEYELADNETNPKIIISKMTETLEFYAKTIIQIIQPEEFHALHECNSFTDLEKAELFELYKKIMIMHRTMTIPDTHNI